jgi:hypothetical protein
MKRTVIACLLMLAISGTASAQDARTKNTERFQHSFAKNFPGTSVNVWDTQDEFIVARFYLNEIKYDAWFLNDASLYAVAKYTTVEQLPAKVSEAIKKKYGTNEPTGVMEVSKSNNRLYYVTKVHHKNSLQTIKVTPNGKIEVMKKETP